MAKMIKKTILWFGSWLCGWAGLIDALVHILTFNMARSALILWAAKRTARLSYKWFIEDAPGNEEKGEVPQ